MLNITIKGRVQKINCSLDFCDNIYLFFQFAVSHIIYDVTKIKSGNFDSTVVKETLATNDISSEKLFVFFFIN